MPANLTRPLIVTPALLREWGACWTDTAIAVHPLAKGATLATIAADESISLDDRMWVLATAIWWIDERTDRDGAAHLFAVDCAESVAHLAGDEDDQAAYLGICNDLRQIVDLPESERGAAWSAAWLAAWVAARDAARDAAWVAARDAARAPAWVAARDAARAAARAPAWVAARDAARAAAWAPAWVAARAAARAPAWGAAMDAARAAHLRKLIAIAMAWLGEWAGEVDRG